MTPLGLLCPGESGEIAEIRIASLQRRCRCGRGADLCECGDDCRCEGVPENEKREVRLEDMGLRVGKCVEMLNNGSGPVLLRVDEARIAIARGMAMKILVRRIQ